MAGLFVGVVKRLLALSHRHCARLRNGATGVPGPLGENWRAWRRIRAGSPGPPFLRYRPGGR
ncbi:MAG: hypothetical protein EOO80_21225, partial [Oxalobacteraceae bacterium]